MGRQKELTEMQKKFAYELVTNEGRKTKYECAIDAGYAKDRATSTAAELTNPRKYPMVVQYIGELREEFQKKYEVTYERHISELAKLREDARKKGAWSAAINAEVARGKAAGLYVEQKIIRTGKLEDLSAEQLESRMKQIINEYSPILEGVEIEDLKDKVKKQSDISNITLPVTVTPELHDYDPTLEEHDIYSSSSSSKESSSS
jgi:phage terminase small subunit